MPTASERLAALRERKNKKNHIEPTFKKEDSDFTIERWYDKIVNDPSVQTIKDAGAYYDEAIRDGQYYVVPIGNLETLLQQYPGITYYYQGVLVDCQQARRWLESKLERLESIKHNYYMYDEEAKSQYGALKTTEASKLAKADPEVLDMADGIRLLAFHEHNLGRLMEAFDNIKYTLNHIVTIHKEKLEEVWVDPTKETTNA